MHSSPLLNCSPSSFATQCPLSLSPSLPPSLASIFINRYFRAEVSFLSSSQVESVLPPLEENRVVLGCGSLSVDYLATVAAFSKPDDKIRSTSLKVILLPAETRVTLDFTGFGVLTRGSSLDSSFLTIHVERNPSPSRLSELRTKSWPKWGCPPGKYYLKFDAEEICYFLKGKVRAHIKGLSEIVEFGAGDLVVIPKGLSCTWEVFVAVDKYYKFQ
ncbi:hypothetical protein KFK09_010717 [Dendrobium nobile]|uniref:(S)-ureidoglycine aminohydrolase cupin domain-containing protein n=1 Tax=Dendrobium nobile TaxID=94219 RepID=A0A8T3BCU7_DENNO|nr:hypothetical protein KFK09_010717 [Dendrobium nobile]